MSGHLSEQRIERYHQGKLAPAELLTVGDHLAGCAACREQMGSVEGLRKAFVALGTDLEAAVESESSHLAPQQMAAYVDNQVNDVDRLIAESHLDHCIECRKELVELRQFKTTFDGDTATDHIAMAAPVGRDRLVTPRRPARWLPLTAAALLGLLCVWLGLMPLQKRVATLSAQLSELQQRNDELNERLSSLIASRGQETQGTSPMVDQPMAVVLNDGGGLVTLDAQGHLGGFKSLSQSYEELVRTVLTEQRARQAPLLADLAGKEGVTMGPAPERESFSLKAPVGIVIESDRPTFRWSPLSGQVKYVVTVYNTTSRELIVSPALAETEWTPPNSLGRGGIYAWEVTATRDGKEFTAPKPPAPQAKFSILHQAKLDELNRAKQMYSGSHLLPGILCAQAGLLDEAEREFEALAAANPDSLTAQKLLRSIKPHKNQ